MITLIRISVYVTLVFAAVYLVLWFTPYQYWYDLFRSLIDLGQSIVFFLVILSIDRLKIGE